MADVVVGSLLENLSRILKEEADLVIKVKGKVESLEEQLKLTHAYLKSFEGKRNEQDIVREYANQVRGLIHEAEDAIDTYVAIMVQQRGENFIEKAFLQLRHYPTRRSVSEKISEVKTKFEELYKAKDQLGIQISQTKESPTIEDDYLSRSIKARSPYEETDVVGFDGEAESVINQLIKGHAELDIIPIVGMSGIGKTTLAGKIYNDPLVVDHFKFREWICFSQVHTVRELLETLTAKCTLEPMDEIAKMKDDMLRLKLCKFLKGTRYLIVLDDVWETRSREDFNRFFPNNIYGSRIILTSQLKEVALSVAPSNSPHDLQPLSLENSWKLLSKKVFQAKDCPSELKELGMHIADKCQGLPLAIVVIAGVLLKKEKTIRWWSKVSLRVSTLIDEHTKKCSDIFELSYSNLPDYLRPCFLYFGHFPEDSKVSSRQLIRMWIAEGFIPRKDRRMVEEVAEEYLEELIDRNLIQVVEKKLDEGVKSCCIHDLLRLFCISKAKEEKYLEVRGGADSLSPCNSRRLAIHSSTLPYISSKTNLSSASSLRSLLCFGHYEERISSDVWKFLYRSYILLRVLDLWGVVVDDIPTKIEKLICLRYLRLKSDSAKTLPLSICKLWNLQTLEVIAPLIYRPHLNVWKMRQLRHFYFNGEAVLSEPPKNMVEDRNDCLSNLQTLSSISPDRCTENVFSKMPNVVKLGIYGDLEAHKNIAFKNLSRLPLLQKLKLVRDHRCTHLHELPYLVNLPPTLVKLTLSRTALSKDPMRQLGQLPQLRVLKLIDDACSGKLDCTNIGFPRLEVLKLVNLGISSWFLSMESMPSLRSVIINRCGGLESLPSSLRNKSTLREMQLWWPNASVATCARDIETSKGKEGFKLQIYHVEERAGMD